MVVHYPRTVWKNSYAEHEVTGKTYNNKKSKINNTYVLLVSSSEHFSKPFSLKGNSLGYTLRSKYQWFFVPQSLVSVYLVFHASGGYSCIVIECGGIKWVWTPTVDTETWGFLKFDMGHEDDMRQGG